MASLGSHRCRTLGGSQNERYSATVAHYCELLYASLPIGYRGGAVARSSGSALRVWDTGATLDSDPGVLLSQGSLGIMLRTRSIFAGSLDHSQVEGATAIQGQRCVMKLPLHPEA